MELDDWQKSVIETEGNLCLRSGRQVGKSTIIALKAAKFALENPKKLIMVIAYVERQSSLIFAKILNNITRIDRNAIKVGKFKPTKHIINLKNGSTIHCYAAGQTGWGIMGFTIDLLIADEAAFINEEVWNSVVPALAVTHGNIWLLSTPFKKEGYYYDRFMDPAFKSFHQSSEDCPRIKKDFLEQRKKELTKAQYAQMYLGEFVDNFTRVFSDEWIDAVCTIKEDKPTRNAELYLGVDIAGMGEDESTFEGFEKRGEVLWQVYHETTEKTTIPETENKIIDLDVRFDFTKIGLDDGGLGIGVYDHLMITDGIKRKIIGLNNARRVINDADEREKQLYKEAMYFNLLGMGQRKEIRLLDDPAIRASLRCIQVEENGKVGGSYDHIANGIIRGAWLGKAKPLNFKVYSIKV